MQVAALLFIRTGLIIGGFFLAISSASGGSHNSVSPQAENIQRAVHEYLIKGREIVLEAVGALTRREQAEAGTRGRQALADLQAELLNDPGSPVGGNARGDVSVIEFFDYRCPYCRRVHPTIQALLRDDRNLRFVYKEWPILGSQSVYAARAALAARDQDKYTEFHAALMEVRGALDEASVLRAATTIGIDIDRLKQDMERRGLEIEAIFARNGKLARSLDLTGTPAFVIGDVIIPGAVDGDTMKKVVSDVRRRGLR